MVFGDAHAFPTSEKEIPMKPIRRAMLCSIFVLLMLGCAFAQQIRTDFDHQANFSQYKTYSWQQIMPANSLWDARIKNAVDAELTTKGWTQVASGGDVAIVAIKTTQQDYKEGTLVIDMYDAKNRQLIWRSSAEDALSSKPEKNEKNLEKGVAKMFKKFPPESAKG
jgi:hypothetical protein